MNQSTKQILFWAPRVLCMPYAAFLSVFAADVFGAGYDFWQTIGALLLHLVPTFTVIIVLIIAWRIEWLGGVLFLTLGVCYVAWLWGKFPMVNYFMAGPLFITGILFLFNWRYKIPSSLSSKYL